MHKRALGLMGQRLKSNRHAPYPVARKRRHARAPVEAKFTQIHDGGHGDGLGMHHHLGTTRIQLTATHLWVRREVPRLDAMLAQLNHLRRVNMK